MNALQKISDFFMTPAMKMVLIVAAVLFPFVAGNEYQVYVMALAFVWAIAVYGMNIITGLCGQLNLAHGGFFAIGAYVLAILTVDHGWGFWWAFVAAGVAGAGFGFLAGIVSLRLKEHYFAIFTLCVGFIIYLLIDKWEELTHGALGIINIPAPNGFGLVDFTETTPFYYLALTFMVLSVWLAARITNSLLGRSFRAIRISDDLAASLGINLMRNKVLAFVLSTTYASVAGALYAGLVRFIGPAEADVVHTFDMITYLLVGGIGTLMGPLVGTMVITWLTQSLQFLEEYRMIVFGPLLVVLVIFFPRGVVGSFLGWRARRMAAAQDAGKSQENAKKKSPTSPVATNREAGNHA
ncbi:ABC transporter permease [Alcanivorax sp. MD8A]|uniref:branched-chain amino acid ABC transporter permease n=1 Tax=Alcanivorax sp. MD8A TaxID=1177157 RepID=UPI000C9B2600|nr:branched-chain amino acid ABC transporter permease [Alcanivorax sp. MD8A]PNE01739.1 ABC transporter permease [Alcanivorax sp. MD8A]